MKNLKVILLFICVFAFVLFVFVPAVTGIMQVIAPFLVIAGVIYAFHSIYSDQKKK